MYLFVFIQNIQEGELLFLQI